MTDIERELEELGRGVGGEERERAGVAPEGGQRERNVGTYERYASEIGGGILALSGLMRLVGRRPLSGLLMMAAGTMLVKRGLSGHCNVYQKLGIGNFDATAVSHPLSRAVRVQESIVINKPASELYSFFRKPSNIISLAPWLTRIEDIDDMHSEWTAQVLGRDMSWRSIINKDEPNKLISWQSAPGADIDTKGNIRFSPAPGSLGTLVSVDVSFVLPGGAFGAAIAKVTGRDPGQLIREALRVFKQFMDTGEQASVQGQPVGAHMGSQMGE